MRFLYHAWPALLFVAVLAVLYVVAAGIALDRIGLVRRGGRARPVWRRWFDTGILAIAGIGLLCMAYGWLVEPYWLDVTHHELRTERLPAGQRLRIVQISDTHCDQTERLETQLPAAVAAWKPDVIVFTGDALNNRAGRERFRTLMERLVQVAPTYAVRGNWDLGGDDTGLYKGIDVVDLDGKALSAPAQQNVWLAGFSPRDMVSPMLPDRIPAGAYVVALHHYPSLVERIAGRKPDLSLAGHTHGGQVALPLVGAIVTLDHGTSGRYAAGFYDVGETKLYVNRGVGVEGGRAPRVRFLARPELAIFDIVGTK